MIKFEFDDKSFLQFDESSGKINIVMCAKRNHKSVVMSSYTLDTEQIKKIVEFLNSVLRKESQ